MSWNQKHSMTAGGHFRCRIEVAQWRNNFRKSRSDQGLCVQCGSAELSTKTMCRTCADKHADIMSQPKQHLDHVFTQIRYRKRQHAAEGYESTGVLRRLLDGQV